MGEESGLMDFYGLECGSCKRMKVLIDQLEKEFGAKVDRYEVWHDAKNQALMLKYAEGRCLSVPFFYNGKTGEFLCGETDYEHLKKWAGVG